MYDFDHKPFSWGLVFGCLVLFIIIEMILGGFVGPFVAGRYLSYTLTFSLRGFLNLASFFLGGMLIGAVSPVRRFYEPAVAAFLYIFLMFCLNFFHPHRFYIFQFSKALIGGGIAFVLAYLGTQTGNGMVRKNSF